MGAVHNKEMPLRKLQIRREGVSCILVTRGLLGAVQCGKGKEGEDWTCELTLHPCRAELGFLSWEKWGERRAPAQTLGSSPSNPFLVRGFNFLLAFDKPPT